MVRERNVAVCAILTFVTFGIYGLYWFFCMTEQSLALSEEKGASGGLAIFFMIITFGIYGWYWAYKMGERLDIAKKKRGFGYQDSQNSALYLILEIIGLGIVSYILIQCELNKFANRDSYLHMS